MGSLLGCFEVCFGLYLPVLLWYLLVPYFSNSCKPSYLLQHGRVEMSSGGSNSKSIDPGAIVRPPALDNNLEPSGDEDDGVSSMQTSDMYNKPIMCERAGRLKTIDQLTLYPMDLRRELAKTIILHDYPLSMVDHRGFKGLLESVYPMVSQNTLKCDISKIYEFEKDVSMLLFDETDSKIAVTVDKFASCDQTKKYIAITGQMINSEWQVQRRMMR